jgi:cysteine synthase
LPLGHVSMCRQAESNGRLTEGQLLIDASTNNVGVDDQAVGDVVQGEED